MQQHTYRRVDGAAVAHVQSRGVDVEAEIAQEADRSGALTVSVQEVARQIFVARRLRQELHVTDAQAQEKHRLQRSPKPWNKRKKRGINDLLKIFFKKIIK